MWLHEVEPAAKLARGPQMVTIRMRLEFRRRLNAVAEHSGVSVNTLGLALLHQFVERYEIEHPEMSQEHD